jgi:predicted NUDIX family NTP pyrophosphohydrolase
LSTKVSAGLLMYRLNNGSLEVLLAHPGGPLYEGKDIGYWGIPKGEVEPGETIMEAALREFAEETGLGLISEHYTQLGSIMENSGKIVYAWAFAGCCETGLPVNSNLFAMEWPRNSAIIRLFPEVDRLEFFSIDAAIDHIEKSQAAFVRRLERIMESRFRTA